MKGWETGIDTVKNEEEEEEERLNWGGVWSGPGCSNWILGCSAKRFRFREGPCSLLVRVKGA